MMEEIFLIEASERQENSFQIRSLFIEFEIIRTLDGPKQIHVS